MDTQPAKSRDSDSAHAGKQAQPGPSPRLRITTALAATGVGLLVTAALVVLAWHNVMQHNREIFLSNTGQLKEQVLQRVSATDEGILALSNLYNASNFVDREEFHVFNRDLLDRHDFILSAMYLPLVRQHERQAFEARISHEVGQEFSIAEHRDGHFEPAAVRERYFPVLYEESIIAPPGRHIGFDAFSEPALHLAILDAIESGHAIASQPDSTSKFGTYLLFKALYEDKRVPDEPGLRSRTVTGLVALHIDADKLIGSIITGKHFGVVLSLDQPSLYGAAVILSDRRTGHTGNLDTWNVHHQKTTQRIELPGQNIVLTTDQPVHWHDLENTLVVVALLTGFAFTVLLTVIVRSSITRATLLQQHNEEISKVVEDRTRELASEKALLQAEIAERERLEKDSVRLSQILNESDNEIYVFAADSLYFIEVNQGARNNLGYTMDELRHMTPVDIKPEFTLEEFNEIIRPLRTGGKTQLNFETVHQRKDGTTYPVEIRLQLSHTDGTSLFVAIILDITARQAHNQALRESEERYRTLVEHAPEAIVVMDLETGKLVDSNREAEVLFGLSREQLRKLGLLDLSAPTQQNGTQSSELAPVYIQQALDGEEPMFEWLHRNAQGEDIPCEIRLVRLPAQDRVLVRGSLTDITERKRAQAQMRKLSGALERTADMVIITNSHGIIEYVNPAFEEITGYSSTEVIGKTPRTIKSGKHDRTFYKKLWETIQSGNDYRDVLINRKKDGTLYYEEKTITPLQDPDGNITSFVSTGKDISERMRVQERLHYLAHHDELTELPNRAMFVDRLEQALHHAQRHQRALAVMFLDLDRFKNINDTLGHDLGDTLLQDFAQRLCHCLRDGDTVARLGGDEFTVLLEDMADVSDSTALAEKILNALSVPFTLSGQELFVTTSIGVSVYPDDGNDVRTLLKNADTAMYRAKDQGRNNYQFYSAEMGTMAHKRLTLETELRRALERNEFTLYYQPQFDSTSGAIIGAEALLRWCHPERGLISPADFIPLLEDTGMIVPVGEWVLRTACKQASMWQGRDLPPICMSVNLSTRQLGTPDFAALVRQVLHDAGLGPEYLELEITESMLMQNAESTIEIMRAISATGVSFAMDDFGTGYSSLSYLKRFPIETLKIDRAFINDVTRDPDDEAIVKTIIAMAHTLKLEVIAEGVETAEQVALLQKYACHLMQGYYFSKPLPADEFASLLAKERSTKAPTVVSA